jgi:protein gp37
MANASNIEWTDVTWNPSTGCSKASSGCKFCYAEILAARLKAMGSDRYKNGFEFTIHWDKIEEPLSWKKPRKVFVNSMSDLFHEDTTMEFIRQVFTVMMKTPKHQYQILTKRPAKMAEMLKELQAEDIYEPSAHIWLGTSVEDARVWKRVEELREVPAINRFLSCEPLIGPLPEDMDFSGISWVIAGGESGNHLWKEASRTRRALVDVQRGVWTARPERMCWIRAIRDACEDQEVAFFFKQWGGVTPKAAGRDLDGRTWDEYPKDSAVESPAAE